MSVTVATVITNKRSTPYSLTVARGKNYNIRGGETINLNYDIWSYLSPYIKRDVEKAISKGVLEISTKVYTGETKVTVDEKGAVTVAKGTIEEDTPKKEVKEPLPPAHFEKTEVKDDFGKVATQSMDKLKDAMGLEVVDIKAAEDFKEQAPEGFTNITENSSDKNIQSTVSTNVFNQPKPAETDSSEEKADMETLINSLYEKKDYEAIYEELTKSYPDIKFTKIGIKKSNSFKELQEKFKF